MPHDYETALTQAADEVADREPTATHVKDAGRAAAKDEIRVAMASDLLCMLVEPDDPHMPPSLDGVEHDLRCALRQRGALDGGA